MNLNNVIRIQNNEKGTEIMEMLEIMDDHDDDSEMEKNMGSNDEGFCNEYEFKLREEHNFEEIIPLKEERLKVESAPPEEVNWIRMGGLEVTWSENGQEIHSKYQGKR
jgi:hypothetical protein